MFSHEVKYFGHIFGSAGIRKPHSYVQKVSDIPPPSTVTQLREFPGLANFQRKFVPNFSIIQRPLSEKTGGRGSRKIVWTSEMTTSFNDIKAKIRENIMREVYCVGYTPHTWDPRSL